MKNKIKNMVEDIEFGLDSRYKSKIEKEQDSISLMEARLARMKNLTKDQITRAKLLQLKLRIEDYLKGTIPNEPNIFARFLEAYVDIIYSKRIDFAKDINISANYLSKVINSHREPKEEFILKLMIHSEKVFENIGEFEKRTWYQIFFNEKLNDTMAAQEIWRPKIEKQIKITSMNLTS